ncbi:MAG: FkbM family methyltransferase [Verrucomicrobiae bacterium]|nr:FkbM family methyltransferase [Verrucomicrobiae bacterium]
MFARQPSVREVHAFEPNPRLLEQFDRNLRLNPEAAQKVRAHRIALGSAGEGSLDAQVAAGVPIPDIVKMDVDGPEADILRGAEKILSARRTLWIVETHSAALEEEVAGIFRAHGHRSWYPDGPWWLRFFPEQRPHPPNRHLIAQPLSEPKL